MKYKSKIHISIEEVEEITTLNDQEIDQIAIALEVRIEGLEEYLDHERLIREEWTETLRELEILKKLFAVITDGRIDPKTDKKPIAV
jgi:hypothetical protein